MAGWDDRSRQAHHLGLGLGADRQRIVDLFPTTHRRVSVVPSRRRIVEIGGGSTAPARVEVMVRVPAAVQPQPLSQVGRCAECRGIRDGNARPPTLREPRRTAVPNRPSPRVDQPTDTSPRDKWRLRRPPISTMRCRFAPTVHPRAGTHRHARRPTAVAGLGGRRAGSSNLGSACGT